MYAKFIHDQTFVALRLLKFFHPSERSAINFNAFHVTFIA